MVYASEAVRCAFWGTLGRNRFARRRQREFPRREADARLVVSIRSTGPLALIDLRGDGPIRIGAPSAVAHDGNHAAGRALSAAVHATVPEAEGFLFVSRFTGHACVAVFERAFGKLTALDIAELAVHADFLDALDGYGISLAAPPRRVDERDGSRGMRQFALAGWVDTSAARSPGDRAISTDAIGHVSKIMAQGGHVSLSNDLIIGQADLGRGPGLRGRVTWHDSDGLDGTVSGPKTGRKRAENGPDAPRLCR